MRPILTGGNGFPQSRIHTLLRAPATGPALVLSLLATLCSGCVYRMPIVQGNFLEGKNVDQLQVGMTRAQVRYLLGTPMVPDAFDKGRWDYLYYFKFGRVKRPEQWHLIVYFQDEKVTKYDRVNVPEGSPTMPNVTKQAPIAKFPKL
jgi:outer membrane protein assembly factor BamE